MTWRQKNSTRLRDRFGGHITFEPNGAYGRMVNVFIDGQYVVGLRADDVREAIDKIDPPTEPAVSYGRAEIDAALGDLAAHVSHAQSTANAALAAADRIAREAGR